LKEEAAADAISVGFGRRMVDDGFHETFIASQPACLGGLKTMTDKRGSNKEIVVTDGVVAGQMYVRSDNNNVVVAPLTQSAAAFAASIGAPSVKSIDLPARVGAFQDTGKSLFDD
jgi:hypothetical protein